MVGTNEHHPYFENSRITVDVDVEEAQDVNSTVAVVTATNLDPGITDPVSKEAKGFEHQAYTIGSFCF